MDALEGPLRWHATTGLTDQQLTELTHRAQAHLGGWETGRGRPRAVPLAQAPDAVLAGSIMYHTIFSLLYVFMIPLFGLAPIFYGFAILQGGVFSSQVGLAGVRQLMAGPGIRSG